MAEVLAAPHSPRLRLWALLVASAAAGYLAALPALTPIISAALAKKGVAVSLPVVLVAQGLLLMVFAGLAAWAGVAFASRVGLDAPWLRSLAQAQPAPRGFGRTAGESLLIGTLATALTLAAVLAVRPWAPEALWKGSGEQSFWAGASSAFYGGIVEELLLRWGVLTALLALARKLGMKDGFWAANIVAAALFGLGHLPAALKLFPFTPALFAHVMLGNGVAGLVFGWLFRRRGLEAAMIAHATADVWLHGVLHQVLG